MSTRRCPNCGERLGAQARFCKACGAPVEPQWDDSGLDSDRSRQQEQPGFDRKENQPKDWNETEYSGDGSSPAEPPKGSGKKWIPIAAAICVLVAVIGFSVFSILHVGKTDEISIERVQNSDGTWLEYAYNRNGNLETETKYSANGEKDFWTEYEYDSNGNRIKEIHYDKNGAVGWIYVYEYDAAGNQLKQERTDKNGTPEWRIETEYDGDKKTKATEYNAENEKINYHLYDYEGKNLVKDTIYNTDNSIKEYTTITYNQKNQKTAETKYDGADVKISHVETSYNEDGTVDCETTTDANGKVTREEHEYLENTDETEEEAPEELSGSAEEPDAKPEPETESEPEQNTESETAPETETEETAETIPEPEEMPEEEPETAIEEEPETDSEEILQILQQNDWWSYIQDIDAIRFESDGTWHSLSCDYAEGAGGSLVQPLIIYEEKDEYGDEGTYTVNGTTLTMTGGDSNSTWTTTLEYVTTADGYDRLTTEDAQNEWSMQDYPVSYAESIDYTDGFFYETGFTDPEQMSNAMWLMPYDADLVPETDTDIQSDEDEETAEESGGNEWNADQYPIPERTLYYDAENPLTGDDVKYVQAALTEMEYSGITLSGEYDSATEDAVIRFQENHNLVVDGRAGQQTIGELTESLDAWRQTH